MFESSFRLQRHALLYLLFNNYGVYVAGFYKKFQVFCRQSRFDLMNGKKDLSFRIPFLLTLPKALRSIAVLQNIVVGDAVTNSTRSSAHRRPDMLSPPVSKPTHLRPAAGRSARRCARVPRPKRFSVLSVLYTSYTF